MRELSQREDKWNGTGRLDRAASRAKKLLTRGGGRPQVREDGAPGSHGHVLDLHWWHLGSQNHRRGNWEGRKVTEKNF